tara:strand:- start:167 stop:397 length:231 start_codon:yes stop_codon:yes gene_type:complete
MRYIITTIIGLIFLSGCATTHNHYTEFSEKPFVETPVTSELLINIPDLDQEPITQLLFIIFQIEQDKGNQTQNFHN